MILCLTAWLEEEVTGLSIVDRDDLICLTSVMIDVSRHTFVIIDFDVVLVP